MFTNEYLHLLKLHKKSIKFYLVWFQDQGTIKTTKLTKLSNYEYHLLFRMHWINLSFLFQFLR